MTDWSAWPILTCWLSPRPHTRILFATAWRFAQRNIDPRQPATVAIALLALGAGAVFDLNAALIVLLSGLVGVVV